MAKITSAQEAEAEFFLESLDEAEDAQMEVEFLAEFFHNFRNSRNVITSCRDALGDLNIG